MRHVSPDVVAVVSQSVRLLAILLLQSHAAGFGVVDTGALVLFRQFAFHLGHTLLDVLVRDLAQLLVPVLRVLFVFSIPIVGKVIPVGDESAVH